MAVGGGMDSVAQLRSDLASLRKLTEKQQVQIDLNAQKIQEQEKQIQELRDLASRAAASLSGSAQTRNAFPTTNRAPLPAPKKPTPRSLPNIGTARKDVVTQSYTESGWDYSTPLGPRKLFDQESAKIGGWQF